jgi:type I site-specific restriction-modification system R (restriction) subunit
LERPLGTNRPDVSAHINGVPVAIEVQISSLSLETIAYRTMNTIARIGSNRPSSSFWRPKRARFCFPKEIRSRSAIFSKKSVRTFSWRRKRWR